MTAIRQLLILTLALGMTAGCGFQLRGQSQLPFNTAYIAGASGSSLHTSLARSLTGSDKRLTASAAGAEVIIHLENAMRSKDILALSGGGKVREYRLRQQVVLSVRDGQGRELLPPAKITASRDFSFSDDQVLAKEAEEALLIRDMEQDILRQIQRQLAYIKR